MSKWRRKKESQMTKIAFGKGSCMKNIFSILICFCLLALYYEYKEWNTFGSASEQNGCSETVYSYDRPGYFNQHVHTDSSLLERCMESCSFERAQHSKLTNHFNFTVFVTKCGLTKPEILSKNSKHMLDDVYRNITNFKQQQTVVVPNIVHYISVGSWEFSFLNYLSFLSVHKFIKPWAIYIHGDGLPYGYWWNKTLYSIGNIYFVQREIPRRIQGKNIQWLEHKTDVMRLDILYENGGIYLDTDVLVLKSFNGLRQFNVTLGRESRYGLGSGIIIAAPYTTFMCIWKESYRNYNTWPWNWATFAVWTPYIVAKTYTDLIHIEESSLQMPSWNRPDLLFSDGMLYDWSNNYAIHVWKRFGNVPESVSSIKQLNSTLGQVMRYVYFDSSKMVTDQDNLKEASEKKKWQGHRKWNLAVVIDLVGDQLLNSINFNS